jgi:molybdopterin/thiamine biosynthesis adenylyltransferase
MNTRFVICEDQLKDLRAMLFDQPGVEGAAFLLCGQSIGPDHATLITHSVVAIDPEDFLVREPFRLSIASRALTRIAKLAKYENLSIAFAHSHPGGDAHFSLQDDGEEDRLIPFLNARVPGRIHGTLVLNETAVAARLYCPERTDVLKVMSIGKRYSFLNSHREALGREVFDRQVRAFGAETQRLLGQLHIGIVGVGGTGSPVAEQLVRLGVGEISLFDGDRLSESNLNRVYGTTYGDIGESKTVIAKLRLEAIGLGTKIWSIPKPITFEEVAAKLRSCDLVFGCTDKQLPRAILTQLSLRYAIPILDLGVLIDSLNQEIRGVYGRVTTLQPGEACLFCRGRINPEGIRAESLSQEDRERQAREGYAPELEEPAPAVIPFTSAVASLAVAELLHRLTGFMDINRESSEVLAEFDKGRIRTNRIPPREDCFCADRGEQCRGDEDPLLGMMWPTPPT